MPKAIKGTATPVVVEPEVALAAIADNIRDEFGKGVEASFAIGRLLGEARAMHAGDTEFGQWLTAQEFPFSQGTARRLRWGAEHEAEVRELMSARSERTGRDLGVPEAVKLLNAGPPKAVDPVVSEAADVDPAYAALRTAYFAIVGTEEDGNAFLSMHAEDLTKAAGYIKTLAKAYNEAKAAIERQ